MTTTTTYRRCPLCTDWMPETANFCGMCGERLAFDLSKPVPGEDPGPLQRFLSARVSGFRLLVGLACAVPLLFAVDSVGDWVKQHPYAFRAEAAAPRSEAVARNPTPYDHIECPRCHGSGRVRWLNVSDRGDSVIRVACPLCSGRGWVLRAEIVHSGYVE